MMLKKSLSRMLEASTAERLDLMLWLLVGTEVLYLVYSIFFYLNPSPYLQYHIIIDTLYFHIIILLILLLLMRYRKALQTHPTIKPYFPYAVVFLYVSIFNYLGYLVGICSLSAGLVYGSIPLTGLIIYERKVIFSALFFALLMLIMILALTIFNIIPYAPIWTNNVLESTQGRFFYFNSTLYWLAIYIIAMLVIVDMLVSVWQKREAHTLSLSVTDSLIEMSNRRVIVEFLEDLLKQKRRNKQSLSVALLDIDHFKVINDTFGHPMGDHVLHRVSEAIQFTIRDQDRVGRYGGEEFLIVLSNTAEEDAKHIAERCRKALEALDIWSAEKQAPVHVRGSFGVYSIKDSDETIEQVIHAVDNQLYRAKSKGRNCVCWAGQTQEQTIID